MSRCVSSFGDGRGLKIVLLLVGVLGGVDSFSMLIVEFFYNIFFAVISYVKSMLTTY